MPRYYLLKRLMLNSNFESFYYTWLTSLSYQYGIGYTLKEVNSSEESKEYRKFISFTNLFLTCQCVCIQCRGHVNYLKFSINLYSSKIFDTL